MKKDFIDIQDFDSSEILELFKLTKKLKANPLQPLLNGKTLGLLFTKSSTRTRVSFEVGMTQLGGHSIFLDVESLQLSRGESAADTARVLSGYLDALVIRTYAHDEVMNFSKNAAIPIINGLTDDSHPCQLLCDLFTIYEKRGNLKDLTVAYLGDGSNNVAHTWLAAAALMGIKIVVAAPPKYWPDPKVVKAAIKLSPVGSSFLEVTRDVNIALRNADVLYTDVWVSMGQEKDQEKRFKDLSGYQINDKLLQLSKKDVSVMHCLPAHRGEEITSEVMDGPHSIIFDQAENRLHAQKALIVMLMGTK